MDLEKFVKLITGKAEFTEQTAVELKKMVEQYPFFSAAITAYLLNLKVIDSMDFENELKKYSINLGSRRILLEKIIELSKSGLENKKEEVKAKWYDEEVYRNAKDHHDKVMKNIIEPKVEKMKKLSELSSEVPDVQEGVKQKETVTIQEPGVVTGKENLQNIETPETKTDYEFIVIGADKNDDKTAKADLDKSVEKETDNITVEKQKPAESQTEKQPEVEPEKKQEHDTRFEAEIKREEKDEKKTDNTTTDDGIEIDDIFKKIEELKKKKKQSLHDFEHNVNKIDRIVEDQKQREVIASKKEENKKEPQKETKIIKAEAVTEQKTKTEQETEQNKVEAGKKEVKQTEKPEQKKEETVIDLTIEPTTDTGETIVDDTKNATSDEAEEVINLIVAKAKKSKHKDEIDDMYIEIVNPEDQLTTSSKKIEPKQSKPEKEHAEPEEKKEVVKAEAKKTVAAPDDLLKDLEKKVQEKQNRQTPEQKEKNSKEETTKSAADKILEQLAQRKAKRQKSEDLIDKFLTEQPKIDRKKAPEIEGDLSEPSTKEIEIVTEKMAEIYVMQGLYEKAIATYEKLILKKPEKNSYFAQKITELKDKLAQNEK